MPAFTFPAQNGVASYDSAGVQITTPYLGYDFTKLFQPAFT